MAALELVVLDVNETLSDMAPLAARFEQVGAPAHLAQTWFTAVLRDAFGLAAAGTSAPFADVARGVLTTVLAGAGVDDPAAGVDHVMAGFAALELHPDVPDGLRALQDAGLRLVTLTNGSRSNSEAMFSRTGVRHRFEQLLSVEDAGVWKPAPASYRYALDTCGVPAEQALMVAVHPWDLDGASRVGMRTAWLDRSGGPYPAHLTPPDRTATSLVDLAEQLIG